MIQLLKKYFIIICFVLLTLINFSFTFLTQKEGSKVTFSGAESTEPLTYTEDRKEILEETQKKEPVKALRAEESLQGEQNEVIADTQDNHQTLQNQQSPNVKDEVPVYICGEVLNPGVYYVSPKAIINEVVLLAGGFKEEADKNQLNLASVVIPNSKIYVPKIGEEIDKINDSYENRSDSQSQPVNNQEKNFSDTHLININTADQSTLEQLPGIGKAKAQAIIEYRNQNSGFKSIEELLNVSGIGQKTFDKLKNLVCI